MIVEKDGQALVLKGDSNLEVVQRKRRGGRPHYKVKGPKGNFIEVSELQLFDLAELLDDVTDALEDGEI